MVAGIDLSTKAVDIVAIDEDNPHTCQHLRIPLHGNWWESAHQMRTELFYGHGAFSWIANRNISLVGIERPYSTPKQIGTACKLHVILGAVLAALPSTVTPFEVSPNDMRRELGLPGNAAKERVHIAVRHEMWRPNAKHHNRGAAPWLDWPDDALDAWAAAHAALKINERATEAA